MVFRTLFRPKCDQVWEINEFEKEFVEWLQDTTNYPTKFGYYDYKYVWNESFHRPTYEIVKIWNENGVDIDDSDWFEE